MTTDHPDRTLSAAAVADRLQLPLDLVYLLIRSGVLPSVAAPRSTGQARVAVSDVQALQNRIALIPRHDRPGRLRAEARNAARTRAQQRDPETPEQWQYVVDQAHALLALDSAQQYGLVRSNVAVQVDRCRELLARGAELGYTPAPDAIDRFVQETFSA